MYRLLIAGLAATFGCTAAAACDMEAYGAAAFMASADPTAMSAADYKAAEERAVAAYREQQMNIARANLLSRFKIKVEEPAPAGTATN